MEVKNNQYCEIEDLLKNSNNLINRANNLRKMSNNITTNNNNNNPDLKTIQNTDTIEAEKFTKLNIKEQQELNIIDDYEKTNFLNEKNLDKKAKDFNKQNNYDNCCNNNEAKKIMQNNNNDSNYSTFNNTNNKERSYEASIEINENTTAFDLYKGLIYMFLSCIFKSLFSIFSKYALKGKKELSSFQLLTYRTYFMMWISITVSFTLPYNIFSQKFAKLDKIIPVFFRTIFAIISMSLVIYSIKFIHISDVYSVYYIYPAFVIFFSLFFLKEKVAFFDILCLIACFIGAILIVKPDFIFDSNNIITVNKNSMVSSHLDNTYFFILVIIAALLKAIEDVIIRNVGKDVSFLIFPFMYSLLGIILFPIPMFIFDSVYPSFSLFDVFIIFLIGLFTFLYMSFMALGFQNESAGRVSMVNYFQVALMYISDLCLFDKKLQILDLIGTCLIFGFNFSNGLFKAYKRMNNLEKVKMKNNVNKIHD